MKWGLRLFGQLLSEASSSKEDKPLTSMCEVEPIELQEMKTGGVSVDRRLGMHAEQIRVHSLHTRHCLVQ